MDLLGTHSRLGTPKNLGHGLLPEEAVKDRLNLNLAESWANLPLDTKWGLGDGGRGWAEVTSAWAESGSLEPADSPSITNTPSWPPATSGTLFPRPTGGWARLIRPRLAEMGSKLHSSVL